ncbi:MAG: methyltransferase [Clostridiales bacterium]|jgi:16S rRNA (guanine1207-N2)-methyltransferase|nr:methyltransferase [Clostridiales bacterium]
MPKGGGIRRITTAMINAEVKGVSLKFNTKPSLFSPAQADRGTLAMLSKVEFTENEKVMDLGCGYGLVGIWAAKMVGPENVVMSDIDEIAVGMSKLNAKLNGVPDVAILKSDGFKNIEQTGFTCILSNPPYHSDFSVAKHFIEKGFNRLAIGGRFIMVTHRMAWYKNKFTSIFGGVRYYEENGFIVFTAEKRSASYANSKKKQCFPIAGK